jgi:ApaG protein
MSKPQFTCSVAVRALPEQTSAESGQYAYAYTVTIVNSGDETAQLIGRHWVITDQSGHSEDVRGLGVVGQQPLLKPGESFEYTSWTTIATPAGSMRGTYFCMTENAAAFDAPIAEFRLGGARETLH